MNTSIKNAERLIKALKGLYPDAKIELKYGSPVQLLVAVILSAQCTDKRVNIVTESLFKKYKTAEEFAGAEPETFEKEIHSTGFYKNKTKNIIGATKMIVDEFKGKVPDNMNDLLKLPGVARKTANVVLWTVYGKNEGVTVDTHVMRLAQAYGLTKEKTPEKIEKDLMKLIPQKDWGWFSLALVLVGRYISSARKPATLEELEELAGKAISKKTK